MTADGGFGQMTPTDQVSEYNSITFLIRQMINKISTLMPVQVVSVSTTEIANAPSAVGFVDVQPLVSLLDGVGNASQHGVIHNIPYFRLQGGVNAIVIDPQVNDIGFIVCADHDISSVKANKGSATPGSRRRFSLVDGIYIGGILNAAPTRYLQFADDGSIHLRGNNQAGYNIGVNGGITIQAASQGAQLQLIGPGGQVVILDQAGNITLTPAGGGVVNIGNVNFTGTVTGTGGTMNLGSTNLTTSGNITSNGKVLATHTHGGVTVGGGTTGPPS